MAARFVEPVAQFLEMLDEGGLAQGLRLGQTPERDLAAVICFVWDVRLEAYTHCPFHKDADNRAYNMEVLNQDGSTTVSVLLLECADGAGDTSEHYECLWLAGTILFFVFVCFG